MIGRSGVHRSEQPVREMPVTSSILQPQLSLCSHDGMASRWYYTKHMKPEEAYVFVEYESRKGRARFTPHTGFQDPATPKDAPIRESVELRALVFWEHEPPQAPEMEL